MTRHRGVARDWEPRNDLATLASEVGCVHEAFGTFARGCANCMKRKGVTVTTQKQKNPVAAAEDMDEDTVRAHMEKRHRLHGRIPFFRLVDGLRRHAVNHRLYANELDHYHNPPRNGTP